MTPRHIFITGGTGFFGKSILDYRLRHPEFARSATLTILSRNPGTFITANPTLANQPGLRFITGDVRTFSSTNFTNSTNSGALANSCNSWTKFDTIIHAAALLDPAADEDEIRNVAVDGIRNVITFAKRHGCQKILLTSSGAVYGPSNIPLDENHALNPLTPYGKAKAEVEKICLDSGIPTLIARCFAFTGPYLNRRIYYAIGNFIQDCLDGRDIVIKGDGTPLRSYLYADDLVEWLFAILDRGEPGRPYNVGSPKGLSIRKLAETVRSALGTNNEIKVLDNPCNPCNPWLRPAPSTYVPIVTRAMTELGLNVTVPLAEAIRKSAR